MKTYTSVIVDDEKKSIEILVHFLKKFCPQINILKTASTIVDAVNIINDKKPDILYLDIQINKGTSFEIIERINDLDIEIIFITAYKDYAIRAIKASAIDYILKPISIEDLIISTNKAINNIEDKIKINLNKKNKKYITIHSIEKIEIVDKQDILYCESDGKYTIIYLKDKKIVSSKNLGTYETTLKNNFIRVHNSYLINIKHVKVIYKKNGLFCEMSNGKKVPVSKRKAHLINEI